MNAHMTELLLCLTDSNQAVIKPSQHFPVANAECEIEAVVNEVLVCKLCMNMIAF